MCQCPPQNKWLTQLWTGHNSNHPIPSSSCKCWAIVWNSHISMVKLLRAQGWSSITPKPVDWVSLLQVHKPEHIPMPTHHIHISQTGRYCFYTMAMEWELANSLMSQRYWKSFANAWCQSSFVWRFQAITSPWLKSCCQNCQGILLSMIRLHRWFQAWNILPQT